MVIWPATLPIPSLDGYSLESGDPTVRTDMDAGPARVRRRFTAAPDSASLGFVLTDAQMAAFRAFWDGDIQQGAAWFSVPLRDGRSAGHVVREVRPNPAKFKAELISANVWKVAFSVEVRSA